MDNEFTPQQISALIERVNVIGSRRSINPLSRIIGKSFDFMCAVIPLLSYLYFIDRFSGGFYHVFDLYFFYIWGFEWFFWSFIFVNRLTSLIPHLLGFRQPFSRFTFISILFACSFYTYFTSKYYLFIGCADLQVLIVCPQDTQYVWFISRIAANRMQHSINGNILGFIIAATGVVLGFQSVGSPFTAFFVFAASLAQGIGIDQMFYAQTFIEHPYLIIFNELIQLRMIVPLLLNILTYIGEVLDDPNFIASVMDLSVFMYLLQTVVFLYFGTAFYFWVIHFALISPPLVTILLFAGIIVTLGCILYSIVLNIYSLLYTVIYGKIPPTVDHIWVDFTPKLFRALFTII
jgi:hypothetical protein